MTVYMKMKYSNYLVLFFDHWIHSIAFYQTKKWERTTCENIVGEDDHFSLPKGVEPLFWTSPYNTPSTAAGIALLFAPSPFHMQSRQMKCAKNILLGSDWYKEHCQVVALAHDVHHILQTCMQLFEIGSHACRSWIVRLALQQALVPEGSNNHTMFSS